MYALVKYTGGSAAHFHGYLECNFRQGENMFICFTQPIKYGGDHLHLAPPLSQIHPNRLMGINLGTYNIWDVRGFGPPQAIRAVERGNYDLMIPTETNIPEAVYWRDLLGCGVV